MSNPIIKIVNLETDEVIVRAMTDEEFAASQQAAKEHEAVVEKNQEIEKAKLDKKAELLARLGLTQEEAKLLLS